MTAAAEKIAQLNSWPPAQAHYPDGRFSSEQYEGETFLKAVLRFVAGFWFVCDWLCRDKARSGRWRMLPQVLTECEGSGIELYEIVC